MLLACWLSVIYGTAAGISHVLSPRGIAAWTCTAVFLAAFSVAVTRSQSGLLVLASGLSSVVMQFLVPNNGAFVAAVAVTSVAALRLEPRFGRFVAAAVGLGFLGASVLSLQAPAPIQLLSIGSGLLFTYLGSAAVRNLRLEQQRTRDLLAEAIAGRDARVRAAALDERARLAREMHDVLAHTLSALSIQLEGTRLLAEQRSTDPSVIDALERAGHLAREGLIEARRAVGSLRDEALPGPDRLDELIQGFERDTGVPAALHVEGTPTHMNADARLALYRIAQESLTNVRKHARATAVSVALRYESDGVELVVDDQGASVPSALPGGSFGLGGMRERAELLGGRLEAGPTEKGFRVRAWIPAPTTLPSAS